MPESAEVDVLRDVTQDAPVLGAELDTTYRVLAVTVEPPAASHPEPQVDDRRLQILLHPVSRLAAVYADTSSTPPVLHRFSEAQLVDVVSTFDGSVGEWRVDGPEPDPASWAPELSMEGASNALDGRRHHATVELGSDDGRRLRLAVWFDEVEVKRPDGSTLVASAPPGPLTGI